MCYRNTHTKWGGISQFFHWGMFILVVGLYSVAYTMQNMSPGDTKWWLYGMHKQVGVTMLLLVVLRVWWRVQNPVPRDLDSVPQWQNGAARLNIYFLYILLIAFPLSGLGMSILGGHDVSYFGLFTIPALVEGKNVVASSLYRLHVWCSYLIIVFGGLHIGAALYHHFVLKDSILRRMLPGYQSLVDEE